MDDKAQLFLIVSVSMIMLTMGLGLTREDFRRIAENPRAVLVGMVGQLLLLPALAFALGAAFVLPAPLAVGLVLIAACPGGAHSNLYASFAKGDTALSVSLTALSGVVTILTIPLWLGLAVRVFAAEGEVPPMPVATTMLQVFVVMGLPVALGMLVRARSERWAVRLERPIKLVATLLLLVIVLGSVAGRGDALAAAAKACGAAVLSLNLLGMLVGYGLARALRVSVPQQITITLEVGIQNGTLAFALGLALMHGEITVLPPSFLYSLLVYVTGAVVVVLGKRWHAAQPTRP
jgi:BASS family bile acid:Na+ symporter